MGDTDFYHHLYRKIGIEIEDNNMDMQEEYFYILDKVINACSLLRYENNRSYYTKCNSINQIDELLLEQFKKCVLESTTLKYLATIFVKMTGKDDEFSYYYEKLEKFYSFYTIHQKLDYKITTDFYNEILNKQESNSFSEIKDKIKENLVHSLPYTEKTLNKLNTNFKFQRIFSFLSRGDYSSLGTSKEELDEKLQILHLYLNTMKPFNKNHLSLNILKEFDSLFLYGELSDEKLKTDYSFLNSKERKTILNQYHKLLLPYLDSIQVELDDDSFINIEFNYNHYQVVSDEYYQERLKKFIALLSKDEMNNILGNFNQLVFLFKLLPLVGIIDEFDDEDFKNIVVNYDQICAKLKESKNLENFSFDQLLNSLSEVISLGKIYSHVDRYTEAVFGCEILNQIVNNGEYSSSDPKDYLCVYHSMLNCSTTFIPPLSGELDGYLYESGNNYDVDRLLLGIHCSGSCLGINGAGEEAYLEALTSNQADVVFVRRKETLEFVARFLIFRKGNFVIMAPIYGRMGLCKSLYQEDFLSMIGNQILALAKEMNDSLDYVFTQRVGLFKEFKSNFPVVYDDCFTEDIPHCDISNKAVLIASKKKDIQLLPSEEVSVYQKRRKEISIRYDDCNFELARIKALEISREKESIKTEKLKQEFDMILNTHYQQAYIGQDWYVAIRDDGNIEKVMLNTNDSRQKDEIFSILDQVVDLSSDSIIDFLDSDIKRL